MANIKNSHTNSPTSVAKTIRQRKTCPFLPNIGMSGFVRRALAGPLQTRRRDPFTDTGCGIELASFAQQLIAFFAVREFVGLAPKGFCLFVPLRF
jgi:hypothetical protein